MRREANGAGSSRLPTSRSWASRKQEVLSAAVGKKREFFTYQGVKALRDVVQNTLKFTADDAQAGVVPIPITYSSGTYTVTAENVDLFLK